MTAALAGFLRLTRGKTVKRVLYVDDNADELLIFEAACRIADVGFAVNTVEGSREGLRYLLGEGGYADRLRFPLPSLLLLDRKMHGEDGFGVLTRVRSQPQFASTLVILFTSSVLPADARRAAALGADACLSKPVEMRKTVELLEVLAAVLDAPETLTERLRPFSVE